MENERGTIETITLVDSHNKEYEFVILNRLTVEGNSYLALAAANDKSERKLDEDFVPDDDITVVRQREIARGVIIVLRKERVADGEGAVDLDVVLLAERLPVH